MAKHRILLKTDYYMTGVGMVEILNGQLGRNLDITVVYSFGDMEKRLENRPFDMLIMEIKTKGQLDKHNFETLLKKINPTKILVICNVTDFDLCRWLYMKGVLGITNINGRVAEMGRAINSVFHGEIHIDNSILMRMIKLYLEPQ
jgi:DNA-binding NarL/FixJ family response regulator